MATRGWNRKLESISSGTHSGGYDYEFIDPLPDECPCAVCHLVQKEPHQVTCCGKIFCKTCLDPLWNMWGGRKTNCPNCRFNLIREKNTFPDKNVETKIKHLKINCTNKKNGCEWTGHLKDLDNHISECPNEIVSCKNKKSYSAVYRDQCGARVQRHQLKKHMEEECDYRKVTCVHCGCEESHWVITGKHTEKCPDMMIPCSNRGCSEKVKRKLLEEHKKACPKSIVSCQYSSVGCKAEITRDNVERHNKYYMEEHLGKAMKKLEEVTKRLEEMETKDNYDNEVDYDDQEYYDDYDGY